MAVLSRVTERAWKIKGTVLNLSHRNLKVIPAEVAKFTFIKILLLNNNKILMPPEEISHLEHLESLSLEQNQLTVLPSGIALLNPTLSFLNLSHNPLTYLSPAIGQLTNLKSLWLGYTQLTSFPDQVCSLCKLTHLCLEGNHISSISSATPINNLKELKWLSLAKNKLISIGEVFFSMSCLHTLYLNNNFLTEIPQITSCTSLITLSLRSNKLLCLSKETMTLLSKTSNKLKLDLRDNLELVTMRERPSWYTQESVQVILCS